MAERPAFDPSRIRVPESERVRRDEPSGPITPSRLNELIRGAIAQHVPATLHVLGEVGNFTRAGSGHMYFSLKDAQAEIRCVMWRSAAVKIKFELEAGMEIIATGGLDVYAARGSIQLVVRKIEPRGVGALEIAFRQLKERLAAEGLFDADRKQPLPAIPQRIAVVTSPTGAAIRDILQTCRRRFPPLEIFVLPVRVQGEGAAAEIAQAVALANRCAESLGGLDALIVGRGGGSLEDLWAFNEEVVARAIAASGIPIVSAVGHEVDVSISDLVADVRAATPTAAAELVSPAMEELLEAIATRRLRATRTMRQQLELARKSLAATLAYDGIARPLARVRERVQRLDEAYAQLRWATAERFRAERERLTRARLILARIGTTGVLLRNEHTIREHLLRAAHAHTSAFARRLQSLDLAASRLKTLAPPRRIESARSQLVRLERRLTAATLRSVRQHRSLLAARLEAIDACDPKRVLARGYSVTRDARTRAPIRSITEVRDKMRTITQLADGEFRSTADDPRQPDLFD